MTIETILSRIQELREQNQKNDKERHELNEKLIEIVLNDSSIINEAPWEIDKHNDNELISNTRYHTKLADLLANDYHCVVETNNCILYFNDNDINIRFAKDEDFNDFIIKHNVKFDSTRVKKQIQQYEISIIRYQKLLASEKQLLAKIECL